MGLERARSGLLRFFARVSAGIATVGRRAPANWQPLGPSGREWACVLAAAALLLSLRVPFLAPRLEDIDSINFDLGVHDYNPVAHQPHPPGYPVYILLAKLVHAFVTTHATALGLVSALLGSLAIVPLYFLSRALTSRPAAALASVVTLATPLVWFNSVRPMSDLTGLFTTLVAQCLLVIGSQRMAGQLSQGRRLWQLGVIAGGLAIGVRLQASLLVGPMLIYGWIRHREIRRRTCAWLAGSVAAWVAPVLWYSGGPLPFLRSFVQLLADALPVEPLALHVTVRRVASALSDTLIGPWTTPWLAGPVLLLALLGALTYRRRNRHALALTAILFGPYAVYHFLCQMTATIRYAVPIVPAIALLASLALVTWPRPSWRGPLALAAGVIFCIWSSLWTVPALIAYHSTPGPAAQALDHLRGMPEPQSVLVSGHYVFTRYLARLPRAFDVRLPLVGQDLRPVFDYWKRGGKKSVLFLRSPLRMSLLLAGRDTQHLVERWTWPAAVSPLMKGERPLTTELWRLDPPRWFTDSGLLVSPEAGTPELVAQQSHRLYIRPSDRRRALIATGTLPGGDNADIALTIGETVTGRFRVPHDFTVVTMVDPVPDAGGYVPVAFVTPSPVLFTDVWLAPDTVPSIRPARGFYIPELDEGGGLFRWIGPHAEAAVYLPMARGRLRISGRVPVKYYGLPVTLSLSWGNRQLASVQIADASFEVECNLPQLSAGDGWGTLVLTSSQSFVPDDRQHNGDRRRLAVRIDELTLAPASGATGGAGG